MEGRVNKYALAEMSSYRHGCYQRPVLVDRYLKGGGGGTSWYLAKVRYGSCAEPNESAYVLA